MNVIAQAFVIGGLTLVWRGFGFESVELDTTVNAGFYRLFLVERDFDIRMPVHVTVQSNTGGSAVYSLQSSGGRDALTVSAVSGAQAPTALNFSVTVFDPLDSQTAPVTVI